MTREEAIEILWRYDVNFEPHPPEEVMHAIDMAIEALSAETEWVPVTERLPEIEDGSLISESVLGTDSYGNIRHVRLELRYGEPRFCTEEEGMGLNIIAWMPFPEPYKEV